MIAECLSVVPIFVVVECSDLDYMIF